MTNKIRYKWAITEKAFFFFKKRGKNQINIEHNKGKHKNKNNILTKK